MRPCEHAIIKEYLLENPFIQQGIAHRTAFRRQPWQQVQFTDESIAKPQAKTMTA